MNRDEVDRWVRYHGEISYALTMERTALESALIPVSAYILIACVECYRRYPQMIEEITRALPPEDLGRAGHELGSQIDPVHLWAIPNFVLIGRKVLSAGGLVDADDDLRRLTTVVDFWKRAAHAYRFGDGTHQAADADGVATPYRAYVGDIVAACAPLAGDEGVSRLNALLTSYLFLLWFDTRSGYQDSGPYELGAGRTLLLRRYNGLGVSHFPWSATIGAAMPYDEVLGAFVLRDVDVRTTDFGTSLMTPADYWSHVESFAFFDVVSGDLAPIAETQRDELRTAAKVSQKQLYRMIASMERAAKIDAGAYVYFTFLRPFATVAGVDLDWSVPQASLDVYPFLSLIDRNTTPPPEVAVDTPETYYAPLS